MADARQLWGSCAASIRTQVSDVVWQTTFNTAEAIELDGDSLVLTVPSTVVKERIEGRYRSIVHDALLEAWGLPLDLVIEVRTDDRLLTEQPIRLVPDPESAPGLDDPADPSPNGRERSTTGPADRPFAETASDDQLDAPGYTFEEFVTGSSNRFAHAAALAVAETPARSYNPLFIYGDAGLGKTHLLQAIRSYVHAHYPTYKVRYVSTETFMNNFVDAIRSNTQNEFKRRYREIDVLLIDDIQFLEGKEGLQEEFFHTFNTLHQANRQIVITSDRPPDSIPTLEDRLRSRFKMGLITDIQPPDLETRLAILRKKADFAAIRIPQGVLEFIASRVKDNIRELEGALIRVTAFANLNDVPCTEELAERILGDVLGRDQPRPITPELILEKTCEMFGFSLEEIIGGSRRRPLVTARQISMYVFRELTDLSYPAIAREFGGRDHTTVIHAVEKIGSLMPERHQIYDQVSALIAAVKNAT